MYNTSRWNGLPYNTALGAGIALYKTYTATIAASGVDPYRSTSVPQGAASSRSQVAVAGGRVDSSRSEIGAY